MATIKQQVLMKTIAILIFITTIIIFLSVIGTKIGNIQLAASTGDYKTIQKEIEPITKTAMALSNNKIQEQGIKAFIIGIIIISTIFGLIYLLQEKKNNTYKKLLTIVAEEHKLAYHQEHSWSNPTAIGSDNKGIIIIEIETLEDNSKHNIITLGVGFIETALINTTKEYEIIGSNKTKARINNTMKALLEQTKGKWSIKAGELRYEHYSIVKTAEELSTIIKTAKKLREKLML